MTPLTKITTSHEYPFQSGGFKFRLKKLRSLTDNAILVAAVDSTYDYNQENEEKLDEPELFAVGVVQLFKTFNAITVPLDKDSTGFVELLNGSKHFENAYKTDHETPNQVYFLQDEASQIFEL